MDRRLQMALKKHQHWVRYCQFSPTATNIASCDDKVIHIWDVNKKKCVQTYKTHNSVINQVKFHSLGNILGSCSNDKKIKLYDIRTQSTIQVYDAHNGPISSFDFHPHAAYIVSSGDDSKTKIWNTLKGRL